MKPFFFIFSLLVLLSTAVSSTAAKPRAPRPPPPRAPVQHPPPPGGDDDDEGGDGGGESSDAARLPPWKTISELDSAQVQLVAKFAVTERNKRLFGGGKVKLPVKVLGGYDQVVAGSKMYQLLLEATPAGRRNASTHYYETIVWEQLGNKSKKMLHFEMIKLGEDD